MGCCDEAKYFNFDNITDVFPIFKELGEEYWPIIFFRTNGKIDKNVIMVHSPVGTDAAFSSKNRYKVVVSGFCTSVEACSHYIRDKVVLNENSERDQEFNNSFNSGTLRTNINKILNSIGLFNKLEMDTRILLNEEVKLIEKIRENPYGFPILLTQALCCIGVEGKSDADEIIKIVLNKDINKCLQQWIENSLNNWIERITINKDDDSILILLGYRSNGRSAIEKLLYGTYVNNNGKVCFEKSKIRLIEYLKDIFKNKVVFTPHPSNLTDKNLNIYLQSDHGKHARDIIKGLAI